jgi:hypothetical protein
VLIVSDGDARATETASAVATLIASSGPHVKILLDSEIGAADLTDHPNMIVFFLGMPEAHASPVRRLTESCFRLKQCAERLGGKKSVLWIVTTGARAIIPEAGATAMPPEGTGGAAAIASGVWAFARVLANEFANLDVRRVDLAPDLAPDLLAGRLRELVLSHTDETEIVLGKAATFVVRFAAGAGRLEAEARAFSSEVGTGSHKENALKPRARAFSSEVGSGSRFEPALQQSLPAREALRLERGEGSGIDKIHWAEVARTLPGRGEIEIAVEATGLNFRDVMWGMGLLPDEILEHGFAGPSLGLECAGRVVRLGVGGQILCGGRLRDRFRQRRVCDPCLRPPKRGGPGARRAFRGDGGDHSGGFPHRLLWADQLRQFAPR